MLREKQKQLLELMLHLRKFGDFIKSVETIEDNDYGYVIVLTRPLLGDLESEVIKTKLLELNGVQIMPDLWIFGPLKEKASESEKDKLQEKLKEKQA